MAGRKPNEIKKRYMQISIPEDLEPVFLKFCRDESMAKKENVTKSDVILAALVYYLSEVKKCDMTIMDKDKER
jgi:hypothetical protein